MPSARKNLVTFFPVATQRQLVLNRELIRGKPYEKYFNEQLWLHDAAMPALRAPMDRAHALTPTPASLNTLLEPGYHAVETGYCELPDGSGYTTSLVPFPGCTADMLKWWFWWHAVEPARYTLWYPHNHIRAVPRNPELLTRPGLSDEERYLGTTHDVDEYIGPECLPISIEFIEPSTLGMDTARFAEAGIVGHACARVRLRRPNLSACTMLHLMRRTEQGFELRSRYFLAHHTDLKLFGKTLSLEPMASKIGIKRHIAGARVAYEQLLHDQIEFTHLSTFLADLYAAEA
jgi:hypothetical protein